MWRLVTEDDSYGEMEGAKIGVGWEGDGLILYRASKEELLDFKARGIAVVLLSTEGPDEGFPRVLPDNYEIGRLAADHLLSHGINSYAYLARGETLYKEEHFAPGIRLYARERYHGYKEALQDYGYEPEVHYLEGVPLWEKNAWQVIEKAVASFLRSLPPQTGLFAVDDALGAVVLRVAEKMDKKVPFDLSVIGFGNDLSYCHVAFPALTSISYPAKKIGVKVAELIHLQLKKEDVPQKVTRLSIQTVHPRESTDFIAIDDPETVQLLRWIRLQAPQHSIQVSDLKKVSNLSLSSIKTRFLKYLGHTPKEEIKRVRVQQLKHLLRDPTLTLNEISSAMRFSSSHEMSRFFYRVVGERPTTFRERQRGED